MTLKVIKWRLKVFCWSCDGVPLKWNKKKLPSLQFVITDQMNPLSPLNSNDRSIPLNPESTTEGDHMVSWCHDVIVRNWWRSLVHGPVNIASLLIVIHAETYSSLPPLPNHASTFDKNTTTTLVVLLVHPSSLLESLFLFLLSASVVNCFFRKSYSWYFSTSKRMKYQSKQCKTFWLFCTVHTVDPFLPFFKKFSPRLSSFLDSIYLSRN